MEGKPPHVAASLAQIQRLGSPGHQHVGCCESEGTRGSHGQLTESWDHWLNLCAFSLHHPKFTNAPLVSVYYRINTQRSEPYIKKSANQPVNLVSLETSSRLWNFSLEISWEHVRTVRAQKVPQRRTACHQPELAIRAARVVRAGVRVTRRELCPTVPHCLRCCSWLDVATHLV